MKPDFREAAERYAGHTYGPLLPTDTFNSMIDFKAGANHGYSLAMEQHRDLIERAFVAGRSQTSWEQFKKDNGL